ncbi:MAG TPA: glycoside hydrolase family 88 protein, partial [Candidatus Dormibacteraeota bacterium]|nr:glycoside hydrolase family 88 protein [Candidatus Dormibacteraeota bacterium]
LVDVLDFLPAEHPARPELLALLKKLCAGVVKYQDSASGLWYQVMDKGTRKDNYLEATASSMFVYTLAKALSHSYVSADAKDSCLKGYQGIVEKLVKSDSTGRISLEHCCSVAGLGYGRDGSFDYYVKEPIVENDLKGVGPFILAGLEVQRLIGGDSVPREHKPSLAPGASEVAAASRSSPEWAQATEILARIKAPKIPARAFPITKFGAATDGKTDCTSAIAKAIDAAHRAGGGRVVVPPGQFLTGAIHLKSNVELHLEEGATLKFSTDPKAYLPIVFTRFEGMECYNYSPLIYAFQQTNIAVTGNGLLDGQASDENWWQWKGKKEVKPGSPNQKPARDRLVKMVDQNIAAKERRFGEGGFLRPSFIEPNRCRDVLIQGVSIRGSPMWELHPLLCTNVIVRGVNIASHGPNNDGCDPESSRDVLIEDCVFETGDDCIAIKSGRNNDGRRIGVPSENLIIRNCTMKDGHGGVVIGSEVSGGCRNVFAEECQMDSPNLERVLRLKSNAVRGGVIENVFMRNIKVGRVADAVLQIDFVYEEGANGPFKPIARNVIMENVTVSHTPRVLNVVGFPGAEISGIRIENSTFKEVQRPDVVKEADVKLVGCTIQQK